MEVGSSCEQAKVALLTQVKSVVQNHFPKLHVLEIDGLDTDQRIPYLHIFKSSGLVGTEFLPAFHVIAMQAPQGPSKIVANSNDVDMSEESKPDVSEIVMQVFSFHGKMVEEVYFPSDVFVNDEFMGMELLKDLESDGIQLCQGIQEVRSEKLNLFIRGSRSSLLEKIRSVFLIEQLSNEVVLRSRLCKFIVRDHQLSLPSDFIRCEECALLHRQRKVSFFTFLKRLHSNQLDQTILTAIPKVIDISKGAFGKDDNEDGPEAFRRVFDIVTAKEKDSAKMLRDFQALEQLGLLTSDICESDGKEVKFDGIGEGPKVEDAKDFALPKMELDEDYDDTEGLVDDPNDPDNFIRVPSDKFNILQEEMRNLEAGRATEEERLDLLVEEQEGEAKPQSVDIKTQVIAPGAASMAEEEEEKLEDINLKTRAKNILINMGETKHNLTKEELFQLMVQHQKSNPPDVKYEEFDKDLWDQLRRQSHQEKLRKVEERKRVRAERAKRRRERLKQMPKPENLVYEQCTICLHSYPTKNQVVQCMKRHEEGLNLDLPVRCPLCYAHIASKREVTQHFAEVHVGEGKTCCCECMLVMPNENNRLRRHIIKKHHTAGKPVICPQCGRTFTTVPHLKVHLAEHNKEEVVVCHQCGQTFHHRRRLVAHISRLHQPRNLKCIHCEKTFENRQQARRHLAMHTGIKPFKCADCNYCAYKLHNIHTHVNKTHGRKSILEDIIVDEDERERMMQLVKIDVEKMVEQRNNGSA